jgi:hypothetical protein
VRTDVAENPFRRRTLWILAGVVLLSLLLGFALAIFGDDFARRPTADANTFSRSALGHNAFLRLLREMDVPVVVSQYRTDKRAADSLILLLEPNLHFENSEVAEKIVDAAGGLLLVLPKWDGEADVNDPGKVKDVVLLPEEEVQRALAVVDDAATLVRSEPKGPIAEQVLHQSAGPLSSNGEVQGTPSIRDMQLIESEWIEPILFNEQGILFGKHIVDDIYVLSDPDLLSNHGLEDGDNASLALQIVELAREDRSVVVDETLHGFIRQPSLYRTLFEFPLVLVTIQVLLTVVLLIWSATGRFGKPIARQPAIAPGKEFLIDNTASLLLFGGHTAHGLQRYHEVAVETVARRLHAAPGLAPEQQTAWLDRIGRARNLDDSLAAIGSEVSRITGEKRPDHRAILAAANRIYRWRQEMIDGPTSN